MLKGACTSTYVYGNTVLCSGPTAALWIDSGCSVGKNIYNNFLVSGSGIPTMSICDSAVGSGFALRRQLLPVGCGEHPDRIQQRRHDLYLDLAGVEDLDRRRHAQRRRRLYRAGQSWPVPPGLAVGAFGNSSLYTPLVGSPAARAAIDLNGTLSINPGTRDLVGNPLSSPPYSIGCIATTSPPLSPYRAAVMADNPIVWCTLGEPPGATVFGDSMFSLGAGTFTGCTLGQPGAIAGDGGTACSFNGTSSLAVITAAQGGAGFTVAATSLSYEAWIKPVSVASNEYFFGTYNSANTLAFSTLAVWAGGNVHGYIRDNTTHANNIVFTTTTQPLVAGQWNHVVVVVLSSTTRRRLCQRRRSVRDQLYRHDGDDAHRSGPVCVCRDSEWDADICGPGTTHHHLRQLDLRSPRPCALSGGSRRRSGLADPGILKGNQNPATAGTATAVKTS